MSVGECELDWVLHDGLEIETETETGGSVSCAPPC